MQLPLKSNYWMSPTWYQQTAMKHLINGDETFTLLQRNAWPSLCRIVLTQPRLRGLNNEWPVKCQSDFSPASLIFFSFLLLRGRSLINVSDFLSVNVIYISA